MTLQISRDVACTSGHEAAYALYTALVAVGLAAAYWRSAREARDRVAALTAALFQARTLEPDQNQRILVSTGRTRASIPVGTSNGSPRPATMWWSTGTARRA